MLRVEALFALQRRSELLDAADLVPGSTTERAVWPVAMWATLRARLAQLLSETHTRYVTQRDTLARISLLLSEWHSGVPGEVDAELSVADTLVCLALLTLTDAEVAARTRTAPYAPHHRVHDAAHLATLARTMRYCTAAYGWMGVVAFGGTVQSSASVALDTAALLQHCRLPPSAVVHVSLPQESAPTHVLFLDHAHRSIVLAIRGTWGMEDVVTDLSATSVSFLSGHAHAGILEVARYLASKLSGELVALQRAHPSYTVLLCGHSLGGGVAALLAVLVHDAEPALPLHAYCFGAPPVLSPDLARACKRLVTTVVLGDDAIPRLCYGSVRALKARVLRVLRECDRSSLKVVAELVRRQRLTQSALALIRAPPPPPRTLPVSDADTRAYLSLAGDVYHIVGDVLYASSAEHFHHVLVTGASMLGDHLPGRYEVALEHCALPLASLPWHERLRRRLTRTWRRVAALVTAPYLRGVSALALASVVFALVLRALAATSRPPLRALT